ncbi:iron-sulfur cluster-binding domain protein [Vibrio parahaemolyticus VP2007-007]|nr:iron-sulfur cluster-binding domain protein [Vibrio parahaemolyticus VP2007-007]
MKAATKRAIASRSTHTYVKAWVLVLQRVRQKLFITHCQTPKIRKSLLNVR